jgi:hypothetical protein
LHPTPSSLCRVITAAASLWTAEIADVVVFAI